MCGKAAVKLNARVSRGARVRRRLVVCSSSPSGSERKKHRVQSRNGKARCIFRAHLKQRLLPADTALRFSIQRKAHLPFQQAEPKQREQHAGQNQQRRAVAQQRICHHRRHGGEDKDAQKRKKFPCEFQFQVHPLFCCKSTRIKSGVVTTLMMVPTEIRLR